MHALYDQFKKNNKKVNIVCITYNQEKFIKESIESLLNQDFHKLNIVISDDHSTDCTSQIIEDVLSTYKGPHQITFLKNNNNKGLIKNLWGALDIIDDGLVIIAAGDDISLSNRASCLYQHWCKLNYPEIIASGHYTIDVNGNIINEVKFFDDIYRVQSSFNVGYEFTFRGATMAFDIKLAKYFPTPNYQHCVEDIILTYRAAMIGNAYCIPELLVKYRISENSLSSVSNKSIKNYTASIIKHLNARLDSARSLLIDINYISCDFDRVNYIKHIKESIDKLTIETRIFRFQIFHAFMNSLKTNNLIFFCSVAYKLIKDLSWIQKQKMINYFLKTKSSR